jgi:hypothetical protein
MRRLLYSIAFVVLLSGCGAGPDSNKATPTGPTVVSAQQAAKRASADLRNGFLYDHNAVFNGGRTMRWLPPIPILIITNDSSFTEFLLQQFLVWETLLGGVAGAPFYQPESAPQGVPRRGIFFQVGDLPGDAIGFADPFSRFSFRSSSGLELPRAVQHEGERFRQPEVLSSGAIQRCRITLDPDAGSPRNDLAITIRHEIGHCLGFLGHVATGLMSARCCSATITADVRDMMRQLYSLPVGTVVTR